MRSQFLAIAVAVIAVLVFVVGFCEIMSYIGGVHEAVAQTPKSAPSQERLDPFRAIRAVPGVENGIDTLYAGAATDTVFFVSRFTDTTDYFVMLTPTKAQGGFNGTNLGDMYWSYVDERSFRITYRPGITAGDTLAVAWLVIERRN